MAWKALHSRAETLRSVVAYADANPDGVLPRGLPGVTENFHDDLDLVGSLMFRWSALLATRLERAVETEPLDGADAAVHAWADAASDHPGLRAIIDRAQAEPTTTTMARAMRRAEAKEAASMAVAAGCASAPGDSAVRVGRTLIDRARDRLRDPQAPAATVSAPRTSQHRSGLVDRIKAALVA